MRARALSAAHLFLPAILACAGLVSACGSDSGEEGAATKRRRMATTATTPAPATPTCWQVGPLPGSDPSKTIKTVCATFVAKPAPADILAKQALYRTTLKAKLASDWTSLSLADKAANARLLKASIYTGTGGN